MMNYIWAGMILISFAVSLFTGNLSETATAAVDGAKSAVETCISILGVMCFWMGLMKVADKAGLLESLSKLLNPLISKLFKGVKSKEAKNAILMNITANIFGIGNAATPFGLKAMEKMDLDSGHKHIATNDMCLFVVLNTASIQLIPTTLLALRASNGSSDPYSILPAVWITSVVAVIFGVFAAFLFQKGGRC